MSRFPVIDVGRLGRMDVLETIDTETILDARMARLKTVWAGYDPPAAAQYDVEGLEFDPIKIQQEVSSYFELMLRDRVNQAARAVTTAFASGTDLEAIASRYPGGVPRLEGEDDERYRRRIVLSPAALSPHGNKQAYEFWALSADPALHDAYAYAREGSAEVIITVMTDGADPIPTQAQLLAVRTYILAESRRGQTDVISVVPPILIDTDYDVELRLHPGMDTGLAETMVSQALTDLVEEQRWIGHDHAHTAIHAAAMQTGVNRAIIHSPAVDILADYRHLVRVNSIRVKAARKREE